MAHLHQLIDLAKLCKQFNLTALIETGTGKGETLEHAQQYDFLTKIQSCEIEEQLAKQAAEKFLNDDRITIWKGSSQSCLPLMLSENNGPAVVFLDAHFPGTGYLRSEFFAPDEYSIHQTLPLEREILMLSKWRHVADSVIVVDDVRIYQPGEYRGGDWPEGRKQFRALRGIKDGDDGLDFLEPLADTHLKIRKFDHQGAWIFLPLKHIHLADFLE